MTLNTITRKEAKLLKPYLIYMNFGDVRKDRQFLVQDMMYQNMMLGSIKRTLIEELRSNFMKKNPGEELPEILNEH